jgi:hypothetical protein
MFHYFVYIVIFFKFLSCIDIKLKFNAKLVFLWYYLILSCGFLAPVNFGPASATVYLYLFILLYILLYII